MPRPRMPRCLWSECGEIARSRGMCLTHYQHFFRRKLTNLLPPGTKEFKGYIKCKLCNKPHDSKGYCKAHAAKFRKIKPKKFKYIHCRNCDRHTKKHSKKLCYKCYYKVHYTGYTYLFDKFDRKVFEKAIDLTDRIGSITQKDWSEDKITFERAAERLRPFLIKVKRGEYYYDLDNLLWAAKKRTWKKRAF